MAQEFIRSYTIFVGNINIFMKFSEEIFIGYFHKIASYFRMRLNVNG